MKRISEIEIFGSFEVENSISDILYGALDSLFSESQPEESLIYYAGPIRDYQKLSGDFNKAFANTIAKNSGHKESD